MRRRGGKKKEKGEEEKQTGEVRGKALLSFKWPT